MMDKVANPLVRACVLINEYKREEPLCGSNDAEIAHKIFPLLADLIGLDDELGKKCAIRISRMHDAEEINLTVQQKIELDDLLGC